VRVRVRVRACVGPDASAVEGISVELFTAHALGVL
jgi:hypothetical protein